MSVALRSRDDLPLEHRTSIIQLLERGQFGGIFLADARGPHGTCGCSAGADGNEPARQID